MTTTLQTLLDTLPRRGKLELILLRPERRAQPVRVDTARALPGRGLAGDHRSTRTSNSARQVTLIQAEHMPVIGALVTGVPGGGEVAPEQLRRNLVVAGVNLLALKERRFRIGGAVFEGAGLCHPCSRMTEALGPGGYNAVRGHGGLLARVLEEGEIRVGDELEPL